MSEWAKGFLSGAFMVSSVSLFMTGHPVLGGLFAILGVVTMRPLLEGGKQKLAEYAHVGQVVSHEGSTTLIQSRHPQIELDALPVGTKVYINMEVNNE